MKNKGRLLLLFLALAFVIAVTGCGKEKVSEKVPEPETDVPENKVDKDEKKEPVFENQFPLTGIETNDAVDHRTIAVMVNNHPKARQQSGLHKADLVYEVLAEGDITRFLAIFQSEAADLDVVGPVRSARDYYIELAKGFDAYYIAHGYSPEAQDMLQRGVVDNINGIQYDGTLFKRANFRNAPHNSYISYESMLQGAEKKNISMTQDAPAFSFLSKEELEGLNAESKNAETIDIAYSGRSYAKFSYKYNEAEGKYERYSSEGQTIDRETETPILLDNLLIIEAPHRVIDSAGRREINLTAGGNGYLIQKGVSKEITWKNVDGRIVPFIDGEEAKFVPGKTWVNLVPTSPGLSDIVTIQAVE